MIKWCCWWNWVETKWQQQKARNNLTIVTMAVKGNKDESDYLHPAKNKAEILLLTLFCPSAVCPYL